MYCSSKQPILHHRIDIKANMIRMEHLVLFSIVINCKKINNSIKTKLVTYPKNILVLMLKLSYLK